MKTRFLSIILVIVLALALVPAVGAQDDGCFGLSAEDCAVIQGAYANTDATSFFQEFSIEFSATNLAALAALAPGGPEEITFSVTGSGPFVFTGEGDIPVAMALDMVVNAAGLMDEAIVDAAVPFAIVDGFMYSIFGEAGELVGLPIDSLTESAGEADGGLGLPVNPADLAGGLEGAEFDSLADLLGGADDAGAAAGGAGLDAYTTYTRDGDVFTFDFDLGLFLTSPEFNELFALLGGLAGEENAATLGLVQGLLAGVVADIGVVQYVNPELNIVDRLTFTTDVELDLGALFGSTDMEPIMLNLVFDVQVSQINGEFAIAAPEGARQLTPEEADAIMGG